MDDDTLPLELWEAIFDHLCGLDLANCSLIARRFRHPSQKRLFSTIIVKEPVEDPEMERKCDSFTRAISSSPLLAVSVKTLYLGAMRGDNAEGVTLTLFSDIIPLLTALETLVVEFMVVPADISAIVLKPVYSGHETAVYSSVLTMRLSMITNFPLALLNRFPNLKQLTLHKVGFQESSTLRSSFNLFRLPETLVIAPAALLDLFRLLKVLVDSYHQKDDQGRSPVDLSTLRNLFVEFPWKSPTEDLGPKGFQEMQAFLEAISPYIECIELSLDYAARFCNDQRDRPIRFTKLQRLSVIMEVDQLDMHDGANSLAYTSLSSVVTWVQDVTDVDKLQEFHLSLASPWDRRPDHFGITGIQGSIMPALQNLESYLAPKRRPEPLRVKISMKSTKEEALEYLRANLARFERYTTLEVEGKEQTLGSSDILRGARISLYTNDML
ncbi:hypothetical protein BKA70DRAFT_1308902 [Coprinopsis sp. MPI-PUGE-AT-0042]|nr:hypothetical protein BKA70DRAFT_1308902 [Coprinopsis sp. MPI-PUGE-AT-0042]